MVIFTQVREILIVIRDPETETDKRLIVSYGFAAPGRPNNIFPHCGEIIPYYIVQSGDKSVLSGEEFPLTSIALDCTPEVW